MAKKIITKKRKPGAGRKPLPPELRKQTLRFYVTEEQKEKLLSFAKKLGM